MKLYLNLVFIVFLSGCGWLSKEDKVANLDVISSSSYKTGRIVLKTKSSKNILVFQVPHPKEPFPDGVILFVMDQDWAGTGQSNKFRSRVRRILREGGVGICRYDSAGKSNLTGAAIIEVGKDGLPKEVIDRRIYSSDPVFLGSVVGHIKFTEGIVTELSLSKGVDIFLAKAEKSSFKEQDIGFDALEYVELVRASLIGLNCRDDVISALPVDENSQLDD